MLNDICLPCCYLQQTLFHHTPTYSVQDVSISTKLLQQYAKNDIDSTQSDISVYLNIGNKMIHVIIYDISISSSYGH